MAIPIALGVAAAAAAKGGAAAGASSGLWGSLLGAGSSIFGGLLGRDAQRQLTRDQIQLQREFAQHGIQWRVQDAKRAGIHPAAALGAFPTSSSPIVMEDPVGKAVADAGQDISGAVSKMESADQRLSLRLSQELIRSQINENDMRSLAIQNDIQRKNTEGSVPGFPMIGHETITGQQPAVPGGGDPTGFFEWKLPPVMAPSAEQGTQSGTSDAFEKVQYPGFILELPSGRGQESPQEIWSSMPSYEKWGVILHNANKKGGNWLRDFVNFGLTGRPGKGPYQAPFMDNRPLSSGVGDAISRAMQPYLNEKQRYQRWKPNQYQPERQRR